MTSFLLHYSYKNAKHAISETCFVIHAKPMIFIIIFSCLLLLELIQVYKLKFYHNYYKFKLLIENYAANSITHIIAQPTIRQNQDIKGISIGFKLGMDPIEVNSSTTIAKYPLAKFHILTIKSIYIITQSSIPMYHTYIS